MSCRRIEARLSVRCMARRSGVSDSSSTVQVNQQRDQRDARAEQESRLIVEDRRDDAADAPVRGCSPSRTPSTQSPSDCVRFSRGLTSAMYACATITLPPVMPSRMRAANSIGTDAAKPSMMKLMHRPNLADHQYRDAPVAVGELADQGRGDELGDEIGIQQRRNHFRRHGEMALRIERQCGQNNGRAEKVGEDDQKQDDTAAAIHSLPTRCASRTDPRF